MPSAFTALIFSLGLGQDMAAKAHEFVDHEVKVDLEAKEYHYDFGPVGSVTMKDWQRITPFTHGEVRWSKGSVAARDRKVGSDVNEINRDFVTSTQPAMLSHKIANGNWTVTLNMGDSDYPHSGMQVWAEGKRQGNPIDSVKGQFSYNIFDVSVTDGQFDMTILNANGKEIHWVLNRMSLVKKP